MLYAHMYDAVRTHVWHLQGYVGKSYSCRFSFSAKRNVNTKATEYATFGFSFIVLVFFLFQESLNFIVCQRYGFLVFYPP